MSRQASVIICDDLLVSLSGRFNVTGIFTGDIGIPSSPSFAAQFVFLFTIETDIDDQYQSLAVEVTFPGQQQPLRMDIPIGTPIPPMPGRTRWTLRWPMLIQQIMLIPGRIEAKVIHEKGEILTNGAWISLIQPIAPPTAPPAPTG